MSGTMQKMRLLWRAESVRMYRYIIRYNTRYFRRPHPLAWLSLGWSSAPLLLSPSFRSSSFRCCFYHRGLDGGIQGLRWRWRVLTYAIKAGQADAAPGSPRRLKTRPRLFLLHSSSPVLVGLCSPYSLASLGRSWLVLATLSGRPMARQWQSCLHADSPFRDVDDRATK